MQWVGVFFMWTVVVGCVEVTSTIVIQRYGASWLLFWKHVIGTATAVAIASMTRGCIPFFYWSRRCVSAPTAMESRLFAAVAASNLLALFCMYSGFRSGGMDGAYAFKATEPLMTCVLSTALAQQLIACVFPRDEKWAAIRHSSPGWREWFGVLLICAGSALCSMGLHGSTSTRVSETSAWILASNFCFVIRTVLQKRLFQESPVVSEERAQEVAVRLFMDVGVIGSIATAPFALLQLLWRSDVEEAATQQQLSALHTGALFLTAGAGTFFVQALNSYVLLHFSPLAFAVAKQCRVMLLFLFSVMYFSMAFRAPALAAVGGALVVLGTAVYLCARDQTSQPLSTPLSGCGASA